VGVGTAEQSGYLMVLDLLQLVLGGCALGLEKSNVLSIRFRRLCGSGSSPKPDS
jgi:hypothetical protein